MESAYSSITTIKNRHQYSAISILLHPLSPPNEEKKKSASLKRLNISNNAQHTTSLPLNFIFSIG